MGLELPPLPDPLPRHHMSNLGACCIFPLAFYTLKKCKHLFTLLPLSGILSLCETQKQLCALENVTQASISSGMSITWVRFQFWSIPSPTVYILPSEYILSFRSRKQHFNLLLHFNLSLWIPPGEAAAAGSNELVVDRSYVKKKLEHGLTRIWQVSPSLTVYFIVCFLDSPTFSSA